MKPVNKQFAAAAFSVAALGAPAAQASGVEVLNEGFGNVNGLFARHDATPGFNDMLELRFSSGSSLDAAGFSTVLATLGGTAGYPTDWEAFSAAVDVSGNGRFAFRYFGPADTLNYVGLDSVRVVTAVPEPSALAMLGAGLGLLGLRRRKVHA